MSDAPRTRAPESSRRRRYDASGRRQAAAANRAAVVEAASRLFVARGWSGTSMRDVAAGAGVSVETVYASVGTKLQLLEAALGIAVVGDDQPLPLSERPAWRAVVEAPTAGDRARAMGSLLVRLHRRAAPLHRALTHAAVGDPALGELLQRDFEDFREQSRQGVVAVAARQPQPHEVELVMAALSGDTYLMLTEHAGLDDDDYADYVAAALLRLLDLQEDSP